MNQEDVFIDEIDEASEANICVLIVEEQRNNPKYEAKVKTIE
jgi:hypothetical protein